MELRTLVTGGSGFVGHNLVSALRRSGRSVLSLGSRATPPPGQEDAYWRVDVLDRRAVEAAFDRFRPHEVVHLAARTRFAGEDEFYGYTVNTQGTRNIVAAIAETPNVGRALFASSIVAEGASAEQGEFGYARSKADMESIVSGSGLGGRGCTWALLRLGHVWGPFGGIPYRGFFLAVARGRYVSLGHSDAPKRLAYIGNIVHQIEGLLNARPEDVRGRLFCLADDPPISIDEWAEMIAAASGRPSPPRIPEPVVRLLAGCGDALSLVGWKNPPLSSRRLANMRRPSPPVPVSQTLDLVGQGPYSVSDGVKATLEWLRASAWI